MSTSEKDGLISTHWKADIKESSDAAKYLTHNNGGRPFLVSVFGSVVRVSERPKGPVSDEEWQDSEARKIGWDIPVLEVPHAIKVYAGIDKKEGFTGNSVLVQLAPKQYLFIGDCIFSFTLDEPIAEFYSPTGNNDVPYPFAVTSSGRIAMMLLNQDFNTRDVVSNIPDLNLEQDPFSPYTHASKGTAEAVKVEYIKSS